MFVCRQSDLSYFPAFIMRGVLFISLLTVVGPSLAGQVDLAWDRSTSTDVGGYKIFYGPASGSYTASVDTGNVTSATIPDLSPGGTYYFSAKAYNSGRTAESAYSNEVSATVPSIPPPDASFTASKISGVAPLTVTFSDTSTGNITSRRWNFGNGLTATGATAATSYADPGTYTVVLSVEGSGGTDTASRTITVTAPAAATPDANFSASATSGTAPMTVSFMDDSTGATAWAWNFGDGGTSTLENPAHAYTSPGSYDVTLTVTGPGGTDTLRRPGYISVASGGTTGTGPSSTGLVMAFGFDDISGERVPDASGRGNDGVLVGATAAASGRFGSALALDGWNDWVTVSDHPSLDLSGKMTLEAWVYPRNWMSKGATVLVKEDGAAASVYYLYANEDRNQPLAGARIAGYRTVSGVTQMPPGKWTHLAATYDGQYIRLYIDGAVVDAQPQTGSIPISGGSLRLGGNAIWGEYLSGWLDDVRVYNRALTRAEIIADSKSPVVNIVYSTSEDRSGAKPLDQASITGQVYISSTPARGIDGARVEFWVDSANPNRPTETPIRTDYSAPFDLAGGWSMKANPSRFAVGSHTVTARYTLSDGTVLPFVTCTFSAR